MSNSRICDPAKRRILFDLAQVASALEPDAGRFGEVLKLRKSHYNLLRLWAEQ
jgi:predicted 2-oxoglutarate/Fe(II)-dependent dioxygenase YbiX